ncbi:MAG TPA: GDSL-type esterase/lipase family protein, partial [Opitutales bacterium]|nr:GDSL-type esterase/lipase family protein [Opitutales bacterium]
AKNRKLLEFLPMRPTPASFALCGLLFTLLAGCNSPASNTAAPTSSAPAVATAPSTPPAQPVAVTAPAPAPAPAPVPAPAPAVEAKPAAVLPPVTILLAGDSTVSNYASTTVQEGWGMELGQFFNDQVKVNNQAQGGANIRSFKGSSNWTRIMAAVQPGDYVLMQFGANDSGTAHGPVYVPEFVDTLGQMADEVRAKQATPLFVTPSAFYEWQGTVELNNRLGPYAAACYTAGTAKNVQVVDLNARGVEWLNSVGPDGAKSFYLPNSQQVPDKAHFVKAGATQMAKLVAEEIRRLNSPLAAYLK